MRDMPAHAMLCHALTMRASPPASSSLQPWACVLGAAEAGSGYDFLSRFFGPQCGINEDSVTGSAHCVLAPYWAGVLGGNKQELHARQCSARGGDVHMRVEAAAAAAADTQAGRVHVSGPAAVVMRGVLAGCNVSYQ